MTTYTDENFIKQYGEATLVDILLRCIEACKEQYKNDPKLKSTVGHIVIESISNPNLRYYCQYYSEKKDEKGFTFEYNPVNTYEVGENIDELLDFDNKFNDIVKDNPDTCHKFTP